jgi:hypothetical protein
MGILLWKVKQFFKEGFKFNVISIVDGINAQWWHWCKFCNSKKNKIVKIVVSHFHVHGICLV